MTTINVTIVDVLEIIILLPIFITFTILFYKSATSVLEINEVASAMYSIVLSFLIMVGMKKYMLASVLLPGLVLGTVFFLNVHGLQNWLPRILELKGFSPEDAGYATSLMTFSGMLGSLMVPRFIYRFKSRRLMIAILLFVSGISIFILGIGVDLMLWVGMLSAGLSSG